ncbi:MULTISPECIES: hypothetical protein [Bradyrhizobium]|uniref:hypothetical protein n=1 Tax=Bradyrhizobium TaxID=374 RepID=UPI0012F497C5|nr:hypothetical protein [Bradyrhizobium sp. CCBAU 15544]
MTIQEWIKFALQSNVVAALVVGSFGVLTLWLGLGKFRSEKWWERKAAAYVAVIEGLHGMHAYTKAIIDEASSDYELSDEYKKALGEASMAGNAEVRKAATIGPLLMSRHASEVLAWLVRELDAQEVDEPVIDYHHARLFILENALVKLRYQAKRDLRT